MSKNELDPIMRGARELSEEELTLIQGGGIGSWLADAASSVGHAVVDTVHAVGDLLSGKTIREALQKLGEWAKKLPRGPIVY